MMTQSKRINYAYVLRRINKTENFILDNKSLIYIKVYNDSQIIPLYIRHI